MYGEDARDRWARLARLLAPVHDRAGATARRLCRSSVEGDDLLEEAVVRAYRKLHTLRDEARFQAWFYAVLLSMHRSRARRGFWRRFVPLDAAFAPGEEPAGEDGRLQEEERQRAKRLSRALGRLPTLQREAVVLHDIDGFSMEEIAAMQGGVTISAVKSRVARGRQRLRRHYEGLGFAAKATRPARAERGGRALADVDAAAVTGHEFSGGGALHE